MRCGFEGDILEEDRCFICDAEDATIDIYVDYVDPAEEKEEDARDIYE